jgi:hypothetical protein
MSLTKEQFEQSFKDKPYVELEDLVHLIEENFGYNVMLKRKDSSNLTDEQKKQMTSAIFNNEEILYQLRQAKKDREAGISTYSDSDEEFAQILSEIDNDR